MADEINKKGNLPKHLEDISLERDRKLDAINGKRQYGHDEISKELSKLRDDFGTAGTSAERVNILSQITESAKLRQDVNARASMDISAQNDIMSGRIATYTKEQNVNTRTTSMSNQASYFKEARQSPLLTLPTEVIEQRIKSGVGEINSLGKTLADELSGSTRQLGEGFYGTAGQIGDKESEVALLKRIRSQQSRSGMSTEKIYNRFEDTYRSGSDALGVLGDRGIVDRAKRGEFGSLEDETKKLEGILKNLEQTFSEYQSASETFAADQSDTNKKILDASLEKLKNEEKLTEEQKRIVRATDMYGGGGRTFGERISEGANAAGRVVGAFGGMRIDDQISEMRLKAGAGQTAVDQFNNVNAALSGDMRALLSETSGAEFQKQFSDTMRSRQMFYSSASNVTNTAGVVGDAADGAIGGFAKGGVKGAIAGAGVGAIAGGAEAARGFYQVGIGIPQTQTALEARNAAKQAAGVMNEIPAQMLQSLFNQSMAAYRGTIGGGGMADAAEATLLDSQYLSDLAGAGITPAQAASLTSLSISSLGGSEAATSVARKAGRAQATGLTSAEQYVGMAGQLSGVGGGTSNLEEIMANAVAAGMDNAKNIQQMVSATVSLSSNMSKMGISGAGGAGSIIGAMAQGIGGDRNLAMVAAQSQAELRESLDKSVGMDIGAVYEFEALRSAFPTASSIQLERMATLGPTEMQSIYENPEIAKKYGLHSLIKDDPKNSMKTMGEISAKATGMSHGEGVLYNSGSEDEVAALSLGGLTIEGRQNYVGADVKKGAVGTRSSAALGFEKISAAREAEKVAAGGQGDTTAVLSAINETLQKLATAITPQQAQGNVESTMNTMKTIGPALGDAGLKLEKGAEAFIGSVEKFNRVLDKIDASKHQVPSIPVNNSTKSRKST